VYGSQNSVDNLLMKPSIADPLADPLAIWNPLDQGLKDQLYRRNVQEFNLREAH
jgi:hypothetical protein